MNGRQALERLLEGNRRFMAGECVGADRHAQRRTETARGQEPFAIILGCSDSRVPPEAIFDCGIGDLFTVRVAGGVAGDQVLGSIEYAAGHLGTPLLLVLGHTDCGAVTAAVSGTGEEGHIGSVLRELRGAIEASEDSFTGEADGDERVLAVVKENALIIARKLCASEPILKKLADDGSLLVVAALYDIRSGNVSILDQP
jgi:carbonic anhydrase